MITHVIFLTMLSWCADVYPFVEELVYCMKLNVFLLQFVYMLDENAGSKFDNIGMNAMANKDKAGKPWLQYSQSTY